MKKYVKAKIHLEVDILPRITHASVFAYFQWDLFKCISLKLNE